MKNKIAAGISLLLMIILISSCATSRNKYGCPSVAKVETKNQKV